MKNYVLTMTVGLQRTNKAHCMNTVHTVEYSLFFVKNKYTFEKNAYYGKNTF